MVDIRQSAPLHVSPERVYRALTTQEGIRAWWTPDAVLDSRIGGTGELGFSDREIVTRIRVDELAAPVRVGWTTVSSSASGWEGTTIRFDLRPEAGGTLLSLEHRGFDRADGGYERAQRGWCQDLLSLHRYLEAGAGRPRDGLSRNRVEVSATKKEEFHE